MKSKPLVPDEPLYQILPYRYLSPLLNGRLTLVRPASWEDPFEELPHLFQLVDTRPNPYVIDQLSRHLAPIYAQCWSRTGNSDALLRAYSRVRYVDGKRDNALADAEGVKITTTPSRIRRAVEKWCTNEWQYYLEPVEYLEVDQIKSRIYAAVKEHGPKAVGVGKQLSDLYLLKRTWFEHENEVRLLCTGGDLTPSPEILQIPCDINELAVSIEFDPRLLTYERLERQQGAKEAGYQGAFHKNSVYQRTLIDAWFPNGWLT